jgi:endonuclease/exonuclease/phosphatase family metal-dependent hydrolase
LSIAACSAQTDDAESSDDAVTSQEPLSVLTFNAGLVRGGVALVDERLPHIAPALAETGADVICMNELWGDEDYEKIKGQLAATHPNAFREKTVETGKSWFQCNPIKLLELNHCVSSKCTPNGVSAEECVLGDKCKDVYGAISDNCKVCLAANTDSPAKCAWHANDFVQGGRNGLALFSKHPIEDAKFESYGTALVHRGFITAKVKGKAIACTHLSSDLPETPYPKGATQYQSWKQEQLTEPDTILAKLPSSGCRVVAGDMNASQASGTIKPEIFETLQKLESKGFTEKWADAKCTWCPPPQNPLASGADEKQYDHIYVAGCGARATYKRVMDKPIDVQHDGKTLTTRMSDHFGVMVEIGR